MRSNKFNKKKLEETSRTKWVKGDVYRFSKVYFSAEKQQYVYTLFKLPINLHATSTVRVITGASSLPDVASPPASMASILGISLNGRDGHRIDLTGLVTTSSPRYGNTKQGLRGIVDVDVNDCSILPAKRRTWYVRCITRSRRKVK